MIGWMRLLNLSGNHEDRCKHPFQFLLHFYQSLRFRFFSSFPHHSRMIRMLIEDSISFGNHPMYKFYITFLTLYSLRVSFNSCSFWFCMKTCFFREVILFFWIVFSWIRASSEHLLVIATTCNPYFDCLRRLIVSAILVICSFNSWFSLSITSILFCYIIIPNNQSIL